MIIHLPLQCNIFDQLILEETLHNSQTDNYFITNRDSEKAIVLGRYCKHDEWISPDNDIELIRRYSGGGVVVIDSNTLFLSLLIDIESVGIKPYPKIFYSGPWPPVFATMILALNSRKTTG